MLYIATKAKQTNKQQKHIKRPKFFCYEGGIIGYINQPSVSEVMLRAGYALRVRGHIEKFHILGERGKSLGSIILNDAENEHVGSCENRVIKPV